MASQRKQFLLAFLAPALLTAQESDPDLLFQQARKECANGNYQACVTSLEQVWKHCETSQDCGRKVYDTAKLLTRALAAAGKPEEAESYLQQAINWRETRESAAGVALADDLTELAMLCRMRKDFERGLTIMHRVISGYHLEASRGNLQAVPLADAYHRLAILLTENKDP